VFKKRDKLNQLIALIPTIAWGFLILYLTLRPKSVSIVMLPPWLELIPIDKIAHFVFWAIWYLIYDFGYLNKRLNVKDPQKVSGNWSSNPHQLGGILVMIGTGALVEIMQYYLQWGREAEWLDLIADTLGVFLGLVTAQWWYKKESTSTSYEN
jgi:glycopeptide antibiotics resistance protein